LLNRSRAGARLTEDGAAFVEIVVSRGTVSQWTALTDGSVDAAFGRATGTLPPGIERIPACLEPIHILTGHRHKFARRRHVPMEELSGLTAWMPGNARDSEWAEYYRFLSAEFSVQIDTSGPVFGRDHLMEKIGSSQELITFAAKTQLSGHPDIVHVPVTDPTPVYPWSLMWHQANRHPSLPLLIAHVKARGPLADKRGHDAAHLAASERLPAGDVEEVVDRGDEVEAQHGTVGVAGQPAEDLLGVEIGGEGSFDAVEARAVLAEQFLDTSEEARAGAHEVGQCEGSRAEQVGGGVGEVVDYGTFPGAPRERTGAGEGGGDPFEGIAGEEVIQIVEVTV
jgi:hypothetical protein